MFITRAYNKMEYNSVFNTLTKISSDEKLFDEAEYYRRLPKELALFFPRIIEWGKCDDGYYLTIEKYAYRNLGEIMLRGSLDKKLWEKISKKLISFLEILSQYAPLGYINSSSSLSKMYIDKTETEYFKLVIENEHFKKINMLKEIEINGKTYSNFSEIWGKIKDFIKKSMLRKGFNIIHGDMCFSNILCGVSDGDVVLKFVDPRGSFGVKGVYGDSLYDYAKLRHSFEGGYEYIIYDSYILNYRRNREFYLEYFRDHRKELQTILLPLKMPIDSKLVEGLIFIGMCARHYDSLNRQIAMYLTGVKLLNEFLEEIK